MQKTSAISDLLWSINLWSVIIILVLLFWSRRTTDYKFSFYKMDTDIFNYDYLHCILFWIWRYPLDAAGKFFCLNNQSSSKNLVRCFLGSAVLGIRGNSTIGGIALIDEWFRTKSRNGAFWISKSHFSHISQSKLLFTRKLFAAHLGLWTIFWK